MCKCGCNTCESIRGPLLTEGRVKKLVSENLQYHIDNNISLMENVFRIGSDAHLSMIKEARKLYSRGVLDLCEEDEGLMETHIGEFDLYENEIVPLDLPMIDLNESYDYDEVAQSEFGMDYDQLGPGEKEWVRDEIDNMSMNEEVSSANFAKGIEVIKATLSKEGGAAGLDPLVKELIKLGFKKDEVVDLLKNMTTVKQHRDGDYILLPLEEGRKKKKKKKEKKDPPLGKPKRGGSKAYYVYVRDPKTKRIKKVSFGSGGLRAKIRNSKARNAFAKRHRCKEKNDRTKPSYWSCRLPRYASQLGLGANMNTFW